MYGTQFAQIIPPRALDSDQSHFLRHLAGSNLTLNRDLTWLTGDADRQVTLQGDPILNDWFDQDVKTSASPTLAGLTLTGLSGVLKAAAGVVSGSAAINELSDVAITTPADNEVLAYDTGSGDWINQTAAEAGLAVAGHTHAINDLSDVDTAGVLANDFLQFDGADWVDFDLLAADNVWEGNNQFDGSVFFGDTGHEIVQSAGDLVYDVPTGQKHTFKVNNHTEMTLGVDKLTFTGAVPIGGFSWPSANKFSFDIGTVSEMTLEANKLTFETGGAVPSLNWSTSGRLDLGMGGVTSASFRLNQFVFENSTPSIDLFWAIGQLLFRVGGVSQYLLEDGVFRGFTDNDIDLGTTAVKFKDGLFAGEVLASTFQSDVAAGTAPLTVASNTLVANLNADLLDGVEAVDLLLASGLREWDEQGADPSNPASTKWKLYFKSNGLFYIDDLGTVTGPLTDGGGGGVSDVLGLAAAKALIAKGATKYIGLYAGNVVDTEADAELKVPIAGTIKNLRTYVSTNNTLAAGNTITLRLNGVSQSLETTYNSGETGWKEDLTNSFTVAAGDRIAIEGHNAGSGGGNKDLVIETVSMELAA